MSVNTIFKTFFLFKVNFYLPIITSAIKCRYRVPFPIRKSVFSIFPKTVYIQYFPSSFILQSEILSVIFVKILMYNGCPGLIRQVMFFFNTSDNIFFYQFFCFCNILFGRIPSVGFVILPVFGTIDSKNDTFIIIRFNINGSLAQTVWNSL